MSAGFSFFPEDASDGRGSSAISDATMSSTPGAQEFVATGCEAMSDTASQRPQKFFRIKPDERNFFSLYSCSRRIARRASLPQWM
jgi:hypothetical protein